MKQDSTIKKNLLETSNLKSCGNSKREITTIEIDNQTIRHQ